MHLLVYLFIVLWIESRLLPVSGKYSITELYYSPELYIFNVCIWLHKPLYKNDPWTYLTPNSQVNLK